MTISGKVFLVQWFPLFILNKGKTSAAEANHLLYIQPPNSSLRCSKIIPTILGKQESENGIILYLGRFQTILSALLLSSSFYGGLYVL